MLAMSQHMPLKSANPIRGFRPQEYTSQMVSQSIHPIWHISFKIWLPDRHTDHVYSICDNRLHSYATQLPLVL